MKILIIVGKFVIESSHPGLHIKSSSFSFSIDVMEMLVTNTQNTFMIAQSKYMYQTNKGGKFLKKLWCCVGGSITR